ncbi:MAG: dUTP diphosphatase [Pseudomonadota bacterium]|nr:dUTP diphosphatase [Pseudomonadota bacterium]
MLNEIEVKIIDPRIGKDEKYPLPTAATEGSAGIDLRVIIEEDTVLKAGESRLFGTGMAFYVANPDYVAMVYPRSGLGAKSGIVLGNLTGVIDADYQGELFISLWNRTDKDFTIKVGERVAQYVVTPVVRPKLNFVDDFTDVTERGAGGFGHSGRQ